MTKMQPAPGQRRHVRTERSSARGTDALTSPSALAGSRRRARQVEPGGLDCVQYVPSVRPPQHERVTSSISSRPEPDSQIARCVASIQQPAPAHDPRAVGPTRCGTEHAAKRADLRPGRHQRRCVDSVDCLLETSRDGDLHTDHLEHLERRHARDGGDHVGRAYRSLAPTGYESYARPSTTTVPASSCERSRLAVDGPRTRRPPKPG